MQNVSSRQTSSFLPFVSVLVIFALLFAAPETSANRASDAQDSTSKVLAFDVFLENTPIGNHEFVLSATDGMALEHAADVVVDISAEFKVKVLFVTAFAYRHNNSERWRNGCLQSIRATTLVNGTTFDVAGANSTQGFTLQDQPEAKEDCVRSFAYWDRSLLSRGKLLNSQTGEFTDTVLRPLGNGTMQIGPATLPVTRYSLEGKDVQVTLAYTRSNDASKEEWVGLESTVRGGRTLRYVRTPDSLGADQS